MDTRENLYNEVPYPPLSHVETHPDRLAVVAALLGLDPVPVDACRVLDVGTGMGANIIPMAAALPGSEFVGIDYASGQVETANEIVAELGLKNIRFECMDLRDFDAGDERFDYVIAHGVYSWVPAEVRDGLLALCARAMSERGIAFISYNTLPGWYPLLALREMLLLGARHGATPRERLDKAMESVQLFREHAVPGSELANLVDAYAALDELRQAMSETEAEALLIHDHLEVNNQPLYFHEFVEHAADHGLDYLGDADFPSLFPTRLSPPAVAAISRQAANRVDFEQHMDLLKNRTFRRTLLCRDASMVRPSLSPSPELMRRLYAHMRARPEKAIPLGDDSRATFESEEGAKLTTNHPLSKAAFMELGAAWPRSVRIADLPGLAARRLAEAGIALGVTEADERLLAANLLQGFSYDSGLVELRTWAPEIAAEVSERPVASDYARLAAARGFPNVPNMYHQRVALDEEQAMLVTLLDGRRDREALLAAMTAMMAERGGVLPSSASLRVFIDGMLDFLAEASLLVG